MTTKQTPGNQSAAGEPGERSLLSADSNARQIDGGALPPRIRLAVIATDVSHAVHAGGAVVTEVRTFDLPREIADYIAEKREWAMTQVSLAIEVPS